MRLTSDNVGIGINVSDIYDAKYKKPHCGITDNPRGEYAIFFYHPWNTTDERANNSVENALLPVLSNLQRKPYVSCNTNRMWKDYSSHIFPWNRLYSLSSLSLWHAVDVGPILLHQESSPKTETLNSGRSYKNVFGCEVKSFVDYIQGWRWRWDQLKEIWWFVDCCRVNHTNIRGTERVEWAEKVTTTWWKFVEHNMQYNNIITMSTDCCGVTMDNIREFALCCAATLSV